MLRLLLVPSHIAAHYHCFVVYNVFMWEKGCITCTSDDYFLFLESSCAVRQCCGPSRPFSMAILDNAQREVCRVCTFVYLYVYMYIVVMQYQRTVYYTYMCIHVHV